MKVSSLSASRITKAFLAGGSLSVAKSRLLRLGSARIGSDRAVAGLRVGRRDDAGDFPASFRDTAGEAANLKITGLCQAAQKSLKHFLPALSPAE